MPKIKPLATAITLVILGLAVFKAGLRDSKPLLWNLLAQKTGAQESDFQKELGEFEPPKSFKKTVKGKELGQVEITGENRSTAHLFQMLACAPRASRHIGTLYGIKRIDRKEFIL